MHSFFKKHRTSILLVGSVVILAAGLLVWKEAAERKAHWLPVYQKENLSSILDKEMLSAEEYRLLLYQTGLGKPAVDKLRAEGQADTIYKLQSIFFDTPAIVCRSNSPVSWEEKIDFTASGTEWQQKLVCIETGDILITPCSHTFGWRNGHAAIVIDADERLTLESVVLGKNSSIQKLQKWESFPAVLVLRLKGASAEEREEIARKAAKEFINIPYGFWEELREHTNITGHYRDTHCSHLVWKAYFEYGYDLDSDGGVAVTPSDIAGSSLLQIIQVYGINPDTIRE